MQREDRRKRGIKTRTSTEGVRTRLTFRETVAHFGRLLKRQLTEADRRIVGLLVRQLNRRSPELT